MSSKYILEMNHIEKDFFGNKVLKDVSIKVKPGEIVGLEKTALENPPS